MPEVEDLPVIKRLPSQLANQIAAGEVIERPASVLKELLENALDAGATRIEIELAKGGLEHIAVADNGCGMQPVDLPLAVSRHATSKIEHIDDLLNLRSLGFRGEALASICSVSQWQMTTRTADARHAAQLSYRLPGEVIEINHPPGTRVSIKQLFHNTPARKKFLRAEQTEYRHCLDVIKRMALSRFETGFYLKHNSRQVLRLPAVNDDIGRSRRVAQVCGEGFIKHSIVMDYPHNKMRLWGWLSQAGFSRQSNDLQYFYINGRIIRDRMINHALRSAYQHILPTGRHAAYVLHLEIEPDTVDINVHPTKYEVRFRESRLIHDFLTRSVRDALQQQLSECSQLTDLPVVTASIMSGTSEQTGDVPVHTLLGEQIEVYQRHSSTRFGNVLTIVGGQFALTQKHDCCYLLNLQLLVAKWIRKQWLESQQKGEIKSLPLLLPERIILDRQLLANYRQSAEVFMAAGFDLHLLEKNTLLIRKIPSLLQYYELTEVLQQFLNRPPETNNFAKGLFEILKNSMPDYKHIELGILSNMLSDADIDDCWREITSADLNEWLATK